MITTSSLPPMPCGKCGEDFRPYIPLPDCNSSEKEEITWEWWFCNKCIEIIRDQK